MNWSTVITDELLPLIRILAKKAGASNDTNYFLNTRAEEEDDDAAAADRVLMQIVESSRLPSRSQSQASGNEPTEHRLI